MADPQGVINSRELGACLQFRLPVGSASKACDSSLSLTSCVLASCVPALRAARIEPLATLTEPRRREEGAVDDALPPLVSRLWKIDPNSQPNDG